MATSAHKGWSAHTCSHCDAQHLCSEALTPTARAAAIRYDSDNTNSQCRSFSMAKLMCICTAKLHQYWACSEHKLTTAHCRQRTSSKRLMSAVRTFTSMSWQLTMLMVLSPGCQQGSDQSTAIEDSCQTTLLMPGIILSLQASQFPRHMCQYGMQLRLTHTRKKCQTRRSPCWA